MCVVIRNMRKRDNCSDYALAAIICFFIQLHLGWLMHNYWYNEIIGWTIIPHTELDIWTLQWWCRWVSGVRSVHWCHHGCHGPEQRQHHFLYKYSIRDEHHFVFAFRAVRGSHSIGRIWYTGTCLEEYMFNSRTMTIMRITMMMMLLTTVTCLPQYSSQYDEEYYNYDEYQDYYDESANYEDMVNHLFIIYTW